jgi:hypothetical protein
LKTTTRFGLIYCLSLIVSSCASTPPTSTVQSVEATVNCNPAKDRCFAVSPAFLKEHARLMESVIIAEFDLRRCTNRLTQLEK